MATTTTNLGLTKPSVNDAADIGVLNSNFDKIDTAVAGKANSWYGLGEIGVYCSDCNNAQRNGWFCIDTSTANLPDSGVSGTLFVETRPSSYGVDVYQTIKSGVTVIQRYYSSWAATWQPWEYVNPPMQLGVEYRTTERYNGKAVYTKLVDLGESAHSKVVYVLEGNARIIRHQAMYGGNTTLPFINETLDNAFSMWTAVDKGGVAIKIFCGSSRVGGAMTAQIWYTKD